jgi:hypothetical protein
MANVKISALTALSTMTDATVVPVVESATTKKITGTALKTYMQDRTCVIVNQDVEVTFGVIGIKIINSSGCYVQIRATSSLTALYSIQDFAQGSISLTTSFVNFPNSTVNPPGTTLNALIKIDSLGQAYRIQVMIGSGDSRYDNNLVVIEKLV